ncbi:Ubiquitin-conjugating enzyme E2 4 [Nosema bombycis CQ1]|jgi:ubiquitin-conjugating enzyme E2 H|uniref:Ubiquitin-conjugating enzyme E2 H n=1 Tax=Nosema bombycis (strain CQ1 / CVCC 102059) TaxID=578461 RepID=R0MKU9_NOSB1|nr:Ubiquitin-conjugating enzyme E2 4 [Nosema bombycis CQ1]EOB14855.1 Ubiquitin-conjugating enzyme E2 4 [Nosema bombycis CQ1]|eukprot:EOB13096.1 Ubiquitin-conjugating enzyme E2 4 [Nosema bombycis CQ1]
MAQINSRIKNELQKLFNAKYEINLIDSRNTEFDIVIEGPKDSLFVGYKYKIHVLLPDDYPFKSPSIGFVTKIFHPNVDETSGSICLDVLNQVWSPMYDLMNIVDIFIPQLLMYPNASDPLNCEAGSLFLNDYDKYVQVVDEYKEKYAIRVVSKDKIKDKEVQISSDESLDL